MNSKLLRSGALDVCFFIHFGTQSSEVALCNHPLLSQLWWLFFVSEVAIIIIFFPSCVGYSSFPVAGWTSRISGAMAQNWFTQCSHPIFINVISTSNPMILWAITFYICIKQINIRYIDLGRSSLFLVFVTKKSGAPGCPVYNWPMADAIADAVPDVFFQTWDVF